MTNYKKGLLSLAAIAAISSSALGSGATYLPLTSDTYHQKWIMFGVNGFKSDGVSSSGAVFTSGWHQETDATANDVLVDLNNSSNDPIAQISLASTTASTVTSVTVNVDLDNLALSETEPVRTMYISAAGGSNPDLLFRYKASLEGKTLEYYVNGDSSVIYEATISATNSFSNPAPRAEKTVATGGIVLDTIAEVTDFNFNDNPIDATEYNADSGIDASGAAYIGYKTAATLSGKLRMYGYNAISGQWEIYDSTNSVTANDFSTLTRGKAYWANMDTNASDTLQTNSSAKAGLVLGTAGLVESDYQNNINSGWNLLSFDDAMADIRTASTGMIVTLAATGTLTIYDATDVNNFTVTISTIADAVKTAKDINFALEVAKAKGEIADTFDLRAFPKNGTTDLVLLSNKRFAIQTTTGVIGAGGVTSLTGGNLWNTTANALAAYTDTNKTRSVYGESALIIQPLYGASSASNLAGTYTTDDGLSARIEIGSETNATKIGLAAADTATDESTTLAQLNALAFAGQTYKATAIDLDLNQTTPNQVLLAATETFYIKDHTFTRVVDYNVTAAAATAGTITLTGGLASGSVDVNRTGISTTTQGMAADISADANTTGIFAKDDNSTTNKLIFISSAVNTNNFNVIDDVTTDYLNDTTLDANISKGAVSSVYSVNYLAKSALQPHVLELPVMRDFNGTNAVEIDINSSTATNLNITGLNPSPVDINLTIGSGGAGYPATAQAVKDFLDGQVSMLQNAIAVKGLTGSAKHNYTYSGTDVATAITNALASKITLTAYDINSTIVSPSAANGFDTIKSTDTTVNSAGKLSALGNGNLKSDLKYNAVYTPDYAINGPLYTLKNLGYTAEAMITGNTNITTGSVTWDSIDLTKAPDQWFANQDYNLFSIDGKAGYWTYLQPNATTNNIAITLVSNKPAYTHHFNDNLTTNNSVGSSLIVNVSGLATTTTSNVFATIDGKKLALTASANGSGDYSASFTSYELNSLSEGDAIDILVSAYDGQGYKLENQTVAKLDSKKPNAPTVTVGNGMNTALSSTSTDVAGYYVFNTTTAQIPEQSTSTATNLVAKIPAASATSYNLCANAAAFGTTYTYRAFAVDGTGELYNGNASNTTEFTYDATLKGANLLTNANGIDADATSLATPYDSTCTAGATNTTDNGVSIKSATTNARVTMTFAPQSGIAFTTNKPYTIYVTDGTNTAGITYVSAYSGKTVYVQLGSVVYQYQLPTDDSANGTDANPYNLVTDSLNTTSTLTGVTLP